jgi:integrase
MAMATDCGPVAPPTAATACGNAFVLDHLSDEEVEQIAGACVSTFDRAVFSLLRYTALRRRGVCWLRLGDVFDASTWRVLGTGRAREKGGHVHTFQVAPQLTSALLAWHADRVAMTTAPLTAGDPLFPSRTDVSEFCTTSELHRWFGAIAARAGLRGAHVHLHAFRKTLVVMLSRLNPLDLVSQWIGHLSTRTTRRYYLNVTAEELNRSMVIPWQREQPPQGTSESDALIAMYRDRIRTLEQLV